MTETVDYKKRLNELQEPRELEKGEWFSPQGGKYIIKFLTEGQPYTSEFEGKDLRKLRFDIEIDGAAKTPDGKPILWGVGEGKTKASLYGQLMQIASLVDPKGQLAGKTITLLVKSDGTKRDYTVMEAVDL